MLPRPRLRSLRNDRVLRFMTALPLTQKRNHNVTVLICVTSHRRTDHECIYPAVTFLFPSQMIPLTPAQVSGMTFKPSQDVRHAKQPLTPVSVVRPQAGKLRRKPSPPVLPPPSSPSTRDSFRLSSRSISGGKTRTPETPMSRPMKKGKERATENDENAPSSSKTATFTKTAGDYSIYKGRGRYGPQAQYVLSYPIRWFFCLLRAGADRCARAQGDQGDDQRNV